MAAEYVAEIGRRIKEAREEAGLTQSGLAEKIPGRADGTQVSKWERGVHRPSDDTLEHIAAATNRTVSSLLADPRLEPADLMGTLGAKNSQLDKIEAMLQVLLDEIPKPDEEIDKLLRQALQRAAARDANKKRASKTRRRPGEAP